MIYLQLAGRLGNQLFQWAAAHKVQEDYGKVCLVYDDFHQSEPTSLIKELASGKFEIRKSNLIGRILQINDKFNSTNLFLKQLINSENNPYNKIEKLPNRTKIMRGFFQNWLNFCEYEDEITAQLNKAINRIFRNSIKLQTIEKELIDFCAVHVRRGDYQNSPFGILAPEFYIAANENRTKPLVLFTDQEELSDDYKKVINPDYIFSPSQLSSEETFALMSRASKVSIANSTYSWWAGYIAMRNGSRVLMPHPWFKDNSPNSAFEYPGMLREKSIFN